MSVECIVVSAIFNLFILCCFATLWGASQSRLNKCNTCIYGNVIESERIHSDLCRITYNYNYKNTTYTHSYQRECFGPDDSKNIDLCFSSSQPSKAFPTNCLFEERKTFANSMRCVIAGQTLTGVSLCIYIGLLILYIRSRFAVKNDTHCDIEAPTHIVQKGQKESTYQVNDITPRQYIESKSI